MPDLSPYLQYWPQLLAAFVAALLGWNNREAAVSVLKKAIPAPKVEKSQKIDSRTAYDHYATLRARLRSNGCTEAVKVLDDDVLEHIACLDDKPLPSEVSE